MKPIDKRQARVVVFERLRLFFSQLKEQLTPSADDFRKRIETKIDRRKDDS